MPAWVHDRADHIRARNPSMPESEAWGIASLQAHALGKGPRGWGTDAAKKKGKGRYDTPKDDVQTANPGKLKPKTAEAFLDELDKIGSTALRTVRNAALGGTAYGGLMGAAGGLERKAKPDSKHFSERHPVVAGGLAGAGIGALAGGTMGAVGTHVVHPGKLSKEIGKKVQRAGDAASMAKHDLLSHLPNKEVDDEVERVLGKYKKGEAAALFAAFEDELANIKAAGVLDTMKKIFTTPIPGTPELMPGIAHAADKLKGLAASTSKQGPSKGFQAFQAARAAAGH